MRDVIKLGALSIVANGAIITTDSVLPETVLQGVVGLKLEDVLEHPEVSGKPLGAMRILKLTQTSGQPNGKRSTKMFELDGNPLSLVVQGLGDLG